MSGQNAGNTHYADWLSGVAADPTERWQRDTAGTIRVDPVVVDGRIFCVRNGVATAFDASDGTTLWTTDVGDVPEDSPASPVSRPAVRDGTLVASTTDGGTVALSVEDGRELWRADRGAQGAGYTIVDGVVYLNDTDLIGLALADGTEQSMLENVSKDRALPPTVSSGTYFHFELPGTLVAYAIGTGEKLWEVGSELTIQNSVVATDGIVYVHAASGSLFAVDIESGEKLWEREVQTGSGITPVLAGDLLLTAEGRGIVAYDAATGEQRWHHENSQELRYITMTATEDVAYVTSTHRDPDVGDKLFGLAMSDGTRRWERQFDRGTIGNPVPVDGGLVVSGREKLYSFVSSA